MDELMAQHAEIMQNTAYKMICYQYTKHSHILCWIKNTTGILFNSTDLYLTKSYSN